MNSIIVTGNLTRDPETRVTNSNGIMARMTVAVARPGSKDKTDFIPVVVFDREADFANKYFKKGSFVGVQGKMVSGSYQNKDGQTVYTIELYADRVGFEGGGKKTGAESADKKKDADGGDGGYNPPGFEDIEEDIPF